MNCNNRICVICAENYTDKKRKPIQCQKCSFECCFECLKKHVLSDSDPMCMNPECRVLFPESYLYQVFSHSFMTGAYRKNRNETLYRREHMLLEGTMSFVERSIEADVSTSECGKKGLLHRELAADTGNQCNNAQERAHCCTVHT